MSPAPSTSDRDAAAKHAERMARAREAVSVGDAPPDPDDLGEPIEVAGAEEVLRSITAQDGTWLLDNGLIRIEGVVPSEEFPPGPPLAVSVPTDAGAVTVESGLDDWAPEETDEAFVPGPDDTRALGTPAPGWTVTEFFNAEVAPSMTAAPSTVEPVRLTAGAGQSLPGITWRNSGGAAEVQTAAAPPSPPVSRETGTAPTERKKRKIGIIGYTGSRRLAPYGDPEWELWGLNNLHLADDIDPSRFDAWFDLHPRSEIVKDDVHRTWLEAGSAGLSCFVWGDADGNPPEQWPNAVAYPQAHILESFPPYFTNSISWMTALAITLLQQRADEAGVGIEETELGVWGVDMATDGEYAAQRPSCEFFIGVAMGLHIPVTIPESSDLLKAASLYGLETSPMLAKIDERIFEITQTVNAMSQAHAQHEHEARQLEANINAGRGALDQLGYLRGTWFQPTNAGNSTHESPPA